MKQKKTNRIDIALSWWIYNMINNKNDKPVNKVYTYPIHSIIQISFLSFIVRENQDLDLFCS